MRAADQERPVSRPTECCPRSSASRRSLVRRASRSIEVGHPYRTRLGGLGLSARFEPHRFGRRCRRQRGLCVPVIPGALDIFGGDAVSRGHVWGQSGRVGQPWPHRVFGKACTLSSCRKRHFVVDHGTSQLLIEQPADLRQNEPQVLQGLRSRVGAFCISKVAANLFVVIGHNQL